MQAAAAAAAKLTKCCLLLHVFLVQLAFSNIQVHLVCEDMLRVISTGVPAAACRAWSAVHV
jgi:hypothetical protein